MLVPSVVLAAATHALHYLWDQGSDGRHVRIHHREVEYELKLAHHSKEYAAFSKDFIAKAASVNSRTS